MALNVYEPGVCRDGVNVDQGTLDDDEALNLGICYDDAILNPVVLHENAALDLNILQDGTVLNLDVLHGVAALELDVDREAGLTMGITPSKKGGNAFRHFERISNQADESRCHPEILFYSWLTAPFQ